MRNVTHSFEMPSIFCLWLAKQSEAYAFVGFYLVSYLFVGVSSLLHSQKLMVTTSASAGPTHPLVPRFFQNR